MLHQAFNTFLHHPTVRLKEAMERPEADDVIDTLRTLFKIEQDRLALVPRSEPQHESDT